MSDIEQRVVGKILWRLVLPVIILTLLNSLDRTNISVAALQMNAQLGLTAELYGFAVSIFFLSYLLFQFPSAWLHKTAGTRRWVFSLVFLWGLAATAMAFVQEAWHLYVLRFCLGIAEAGFAPGIVFLCRTWMPKQHRAKAIAGTMLAIPISVVIGNPLSGWLISMNNPLGIAGWRWMFLIEGLPSILLAFVALKIFVNAPGEARWMDEEEKRWLQDTLAKEEEDESGEQIALFFQVLKNPRILLSGCIWFCLIFGSYGILFWLPLVMQEMTNLSEFHIGVLSTLPWIGLATGLVVVSSHSDRTQERFWHVGLAAILASISLLISANVPWNAVSLLFLVIMGFGLGGAQGTFWTIPTSLMSKAVAANGIVLINLIGNISSLVNSSIIGIVRETTGSFNSAVYLLSFILLMAAFFVFLIARLSWRESTG